MKWALTVAVFILCLIPLAASDSSSADGPGWMYDPVTRELTVTENVPDYADSEPRPWEAEIPTAVTLRIEDGVSQIGNRAFRGAVSLQNVIFSGLVVRIGDSCFSGCSDLQNITFYDSLALIGDHAFSDCSNLARVTVYGTPVCGSGIFDGAGSSVGGFDIVCLARSVPDGMFRPSDGKTVMIHSADLSHVQAVGASAFRGAVLFDAVIPIGVESVGQYAFSGSSVRTVTVAGNPEFGTHAFSDCISLTSANIVSVTAVPESMFEGCTSLSDVALSDRIVSVADRAFGQTALAELVFPGTLADIGTESFSGCAHLLHLALTDSAEHLGDRAFSGCISLRTVELQHVVHPGNGVFDGCAAVERAYSPDGAFVFPSACRVYTEFTSGADVMVKYDFGSAGGSCVLFSDTQMGSSLISGSQEKSFRGWQDALGNRVMDTVSLTESTVLYAQWAQDEDGGFLWLDAVLAAVSVLCAVTAAAVCFRRD